MLILHNNCYFTDAKGTVLVDFLICEGSFKTTLSEILDKVNTTEQPVCVLDRSNNPTICQITQYWSIQ